MNELTRLALEIQKFCEEREWPFCFIGGLAVQYWGEPRLTQDVDLTLFTGFGCEPEFITELLKHFRPRVDDPHLFFLHSRVALLYSSKGLGIDISLGAFPFEEDAVKRSKKVTLEKRAKVRLCTAEDLIVMKAFAARGIDWNDVRGILVRQGTKKLDWTYIHRHLDVLAELKEEPQIVTQLQSLRAEVAASEP
jgi:hypothetical protein